LLEDADGRLWGTCSGSKGAKTGGTIFVINKDGSGYEVVHQLEGSPWEGATPASRLLVFNKGVVYGVTTYGGLGNNGSLFRLSSADAVAITAITKTAEVPAVIRVKAVPGWLCRLEASTAVAPSNWTAVADGRADAAGELSLTDTESSGQELRFYRVRATPSRAAEVE
jgi:uncharacterized repeat protein (TIGR03803 family)